MTLGGAHGIVGPGQQRVQRFRALWDLARDADRDGQGDRGVPRAVVGEGLAFEARAQLFGISGTRAVPEEGDTHVLFRFRCAARCCFRFPLGRTRPGARDLSRQEGDIDAPLPGPSQAVNMGGRITGPDRH